MGVILYLCHKCKEYSYFNGSDAKEHTCWRCKKKMETGITRISGYTEYPDENGVLTIPYGVSSLEANAFAGCEDIKEIRFETTSLREIPDGCFLKCRKLTKVEIPGTIKLIGSLAFYLCDRLKDIMLSDGIENIGEYAFFGTAQDSLLLPRSLKKINKVLNWKDIRVIALPSSLEKICDDFIECASDDVRIIAEKEAYAGRFLASKGRAFLDYKVKDGFIFTSSANNTLFVDWNKKGENVVVDLSVSSIPPFAFAGLEIRKIELPEVTEIGDNAFWGCMQLEEVKFGSKLQKIGAGAFSNSNLKGMLELPEELTEIGDNAFAGCTQLKEVKFGSKLQKIGAGAFGDADMEYIELPETVTELAMDAFKKNCLVSINGKMPWYGVHLVELNEKERAIEGYKDQINVIQNELSVLEEQIQKHNEKKPDGMELLPEYQEKQKNVLSRIHVKNGVKEKELNNIEKQISALESDTVKLMNERKKCSIFSTTKKKDIDVQIASLQSKKQLLEETKECKTADYSKTIARLNDELKMINAKVALLALWEEEANTLSGSRNIAVEKHRTFSDKLELAEKEYIAQKDCFEAECRQWKERYERFIEEDAKRKIKCRRADISEKLKSAYDSIVFPYHTVCDEKSDSGDSHDSFECDAARMIYERYQLSEANCEMEYVKLHNQFVEDHAEEIAEVLAIDEKLMLPQDNREKYLVKMAEPDQKINNLPEEFTRLNQLLQSDEWNTFAENAEENVQCVVATKNDFDIFFPGTDYVRYGDEKQQIIFLPYCIILCGTRVGKGHRLVRSYVDIDVVLQAGEDSTEESNTWIRFCDKDLFYDDDGLVFAFQSSRKAVSFIQAFYQYRELFENGKLKPVYESILASEDISVIENEIKSCDEAIEGKEE